MFLISEVERKACKKTTGKDGIFKSASDVEILYKKNEKVTILTKVLDEDSSS